MTNMQQYIEDLIEGAKRAGAKVEMHCKEGREEKLAMDPGIAAALGTAIPLPGTGPLFAAAAAPDGRGWGAAGGSIGGMLGGGFLGGLTGLGIGSLLKHPEIGAGIGTSLGAIGGSGWGAHEGGKSDWQRFKEKMSADASTLLGGIPGLGPYLSGLNASAHDQTMGSGALTGMGSGLGQLAGGGIGAGLGGMAGHSLAELLDANPELGALLGSAVGGLGGAAGGGMLGAAGGRALGEPAKPKKEKRAAFELAYEAGFKAACEKFAVVGAVKAVSSGLWPTIKNIGQKTVSALNRPEVGAGMTALQGAQMLRPQSPG